MAAQPAAAARRTAEVGPAARTAPRVVAPQLPGAPRAAPQHRATVSAAPAQGSQAPTGCPRAARGAEHHPSPGGLGRQATGHRWRATPHLRVVPRPVRCALSPGLLVHFSFHNRRLTLPGDSYTRPRRPPDKPVALIIDRLQAGATARTVNRPPHRAASPRPAPPHAHAGRTARTRRFHRTSTPNRSLPAKSPGVTPPTPRPT